MFKFKNIRYYLLQTIILLYLSACSNVTPIREIKSPPMTLIQGVVIKQNVTELLLKDNTGEITVNLFSDNARTKIPDLLNRQITVYGIVHRGTPRTFDAYVIKTSDNQQYILESPTPHMGFVIQSSFE